jgi:hydrogenase/urease accessory protein HupE
VTPVRALVRALVLLALLLAGACACAHEMTMAEMTVRELQSGQLMWSWGIPAAGKPIESELQVRWPGDCREEEERVLRCGAGGLAGPLAVEGLGRSYSAAIINIQWKSGEQRSYTLTPRRPEVRLYGGADDGRGLADVALTYAVLGFEHILSGFDHLLFVISLLFLVGFHRRLVGTITAFTAAHSLTLAASALGAISLRSPPVEATIALSILLVSVEALRERDTWTRRWPALVAFVFGLVHGLGFAGALADIGLPARHANAALLTFNVGVEAGQLFVVGCAWLLMLALRRLPRPATARASALYAIGAIAAYWTLSRLAAFG